MKEELLRAIDEGRALEAELDAVVVDEPANADGRWTAKDHLAHLAWWRRRSAKTIDSVRTGAALPPLAGEDDVQNAIIYAEERSRPAAGVKADARESWDAIRRALEESSDDDLAKLHPRFEGSRIWEAVPGAVGHTATHVWTSLLEVGEEKRAIEVAQWGAELEGRFFSTAEKLADSRYNLACVYARLGRAEEALALLRESFAAKPEQVEWARKDRDFDRIREELAPILM